MAKGLVVDFKDVESGGGGGGARVPEDDYRVKVVEIKHGKSKTSENPMLTWRFQITKGKHKGKKLKPDYTTLTKESLWKLLSLLEAMGFDVAKKKLDIAPIIKKAMNKELGVTVVDDEYEGKIQSKISDYIDLETLEAGADDDDDEFDDDEDDKKSKKKGKKKGKKSKKSDDDEEIEDLDLDEL